MKAPWRDFAGNEIYDGDVISHPTGERGKIVFLPDYSDAADQWRVLYEEDSPLSRLCLQIGEKGQAVVVERASDISPRVITRVMDDGVQTKDGAA